MSSENSVIKANNKRLAKNTTLLYVRMMFVLLISLYLVRLLLNHLGVVDYGIYNVVTSITLFMGVISSSMTSAAQRFFSFALGKDNLQWYKDSFTLLIIVFVVITIIGSILLKFIGVWFINNHMVIPPNRISSAITLLNLTISTFCLNTLTIPFISSVISYERMNVFAYISIGEIILKLIAVISLGYIDLDKLVGIGVMYLLVSAVVAMTYILYCFKYIDGCRLTKCRDYNLLKSLISYMGWNLFGTTTATMNIQGQSLLLNVFFGPTINAAKGIADQVNSAVSSFVTNFYTALNPQIIKSYASGDLNYTCQLLMRSSKYSFFLLEILALPLICNMHGILALWLGAEAVTNEMVVFCQLVLLIAFTNALEGPLTQVVRATGQIKMYQIKVGVQTLLFIPICYVVFKFGVDAYFSLIVLLLINSIVLFTRVGMVRDILDVNKGVYAKEVVLPSLISIAFCSTILWIYSYLRGTLFHINVIISTMISVCIVLIIVLFVGLSSDERHMISNMIKQALLK